MFTKLFCCCWSYRFGGRAKRDGERTNNKKEFCKHFVNNINKLYYYLSCIIRGQWPTGLDMGLQVGGRGFDSPLDYYFIFIFYNYPNE